MNDAADLYSVARRLFEPAGPARITEESYRIASRVVRFKFASSSLADKLLPAFRHLEPAASDPASLTICAWDDATARVDTPEFVTHATDHGLAFCEGPVRMAIDLQSRRLEAYDPRVRLGLFRVPDHATMSGWESGAPFLRILHWWATTEGLQLVHGAAVGTEQGAALLVGRGGSGKSTTALACIGSQLGYVADDYCLLDTVGMAVHSIFGSGKADKASIERLPRLAGLFSSGISDPNGKTIIFLADHGGSILRQAPLKAIVAPRITTDGLGSAERISRAEALRSLAPSTVFQLPSDRAEALSRLGLLIRRLPCWRLDLSESPDAACDLLHDILLDKA